MSDFTGDPTWDGGWEDGVERGDSLERWILERDRTVDSDGRSQRIGSTAHEMRTLTEPDEDD